MKAPADASLLSIMAGITSASIYGAGIAGQTLTAASISAPSLLRVAGLFILALASGGSGDILWT